jgi:carbon-monoxide dehydrogenase medium subunit
MSLPHFDYYRPKTIEEAVSLFQQQGAGARIMAGGTDLLVKMRHNVLKPKAVIALKGIDGLNRIHFDRRTGLTIGATTLLADVASHPQIRRHYPAVAQAAAGTANVQVRHMATVVGNLCNASPSADNAPTLLVMEAKVHIIGPRGGRCLDLNTFFKGPGLTALRPGEIVTAVAIGPPRSASGACYLHLSARGRMDCSAVGVGVMVERSGSRCRSVRIAVGACAPTPMRAFKAEALAAQAPFGKALVAKLAAAAEAETMPIDDVRASADYRRRMVNVLTGRALELAWQQAGN